MSYAEALERLKKVEHGPGKAVPKVTKGASGTYGTPDPGAFENIKASGTNGGCQSKALSEPHSYRNEISEKATPGSAISDKTMPTRSELARICRLAVADFPSVDPERLRRFLECAEDPAWCSERVARHIARRMADGFIREPNPYPRRED